jgi:hypothetical protein
MTRKLLALGSFASLALALPAVAAENSGSSVNAVPGSLRSTVLCRDVTSVPVTVDAEQTLPMQLVTRLNCGAEVSLISDSEGYTVNVRTAEGQTGYVARMYLSEFTPRTVQAAQSASVDNGIARWKSGTAGSDQFYSEGKLVESLTANGITVQVALQDTGWKMRASVAIVNATNQNAHFNPKSFTLDELMPRLRTLAYQNPRELAKAPTHEVYWTNATATAPAASLLAASYKGSANVITTNYLAQDAQQVQSPAPILEARTLAPKEKTAGVVWFERDKNPQQLTLRIFVNEQIFEFPLSFPQH